MSSSNGHRPSADWQSEAEAVRPMGFLTHEDRLDMYPRLHASERVDHARRDHAELNESRATRDLLHGIIEQLAQLNNHISQLVSIVAKNQASIDCAAPQHSSNQSNGHEPQGNYAIAPASSENKSSMIHRMILASGRAGRTDAEGARETGIKTCNYRSLRSRLKVQDLVYNSGRKRMGPTGSEHIVWLARPKSEADQFSWGVRR